MVERPRYELRNAYFAKVLIPEDFVKCQRDTIGPEQVPYLVLKLTPRATLKPMKPAEAVPKVTMSFPTSPITVDSPLVSPSHNVESLFMTEADTHDDLWITRSISYDDGASSSRPRISLPSSAQIADSTEISDRRFEKRMFVTKNSQSLHQPPRRISPRKAQTTRTH
jgi:hypothetical protein